MIHTDLVKSLLSMSEEMPMEELHRLTMKSGTRANLLRRAFRRFNNAVDCEACEMMGLVGVGRISFAERRLDEFFRRVQRRFNLPNLTV
jgi:hypothetical protein